jgi:hypothetical protein
MERVCLMYDVCITVCTASQAQNGIRIKVGRHFLVSKHFQTGPAAHPASTSMGSEVLSRGQAAGT